MNRYAAIAVLIAVLGTLTLFAYFSFFSRVIINALTHRMNIMGTSITQQIQQADDDLKAAIAAEATATAAASAKIQTLVEELAAQNNQGPVDQATLAAFLSDVGSATTQINASASQLAAAASTPDPTAPPVSGAPGTTPPADGQSASGASS